MTFEDRVYELANPNHVCGISSHFKPLYLTNTLVDRFVDGRIILRQILKDWIAVALDRDE